MNKRDNPLFLFELRVKLRTDEPTIVIDAFEHDRVGISGSQRIDVSVRQGGKVIFPIGALYCGTPPAGGMTVDGIRAKELVLSLVGMKPGDTDSEYFESYTPEQLAWANHNGEALSCEREYRYCDENGSCRS